MHCIDGYGLNPPNGLPLLLGLLFLTVDLKVGYGELTVKFFYGFIVQIVMLVNLVHKHFETIVLD